MPGISRLSRGQESCLGTKGARPGPGASSYEFRLSKPLRSSKEVAFGFNPLALHCMLCHVVCLLCLVPCI
jgi:hypothetical protein